MLGDGPLGPSAKSTHKPLGTELGRRRRRGYTLWTDDMVRRMQAHPDMTAAEIAAALGVTPSAVRHARQRYGRFASGTAGLCIVCDERPVFETSPQARAMRLCKGCYLRERALRAAEEAESNRVRQSVHRASRGC